STPFIGNLDAHRVLTGNGSYDTNARHLEIQGEVVRQRRDFVNAQAGLQGNFVLRDDRTRIDADHAHVQTKVGKRLFQESGSLSQALVLLCIGKWLGFIQQGEGRKLVAGETLLFRYRAGADDRHESTDERFGSGSVYETTNSDPGL